MSKVPTGGGVTAHIDCMIVSGFPGIGKTWTYNEMKASNPLARCVDMDVKDYGTTNGMDVADPAGYVTQCKILSATNACIFVTADPEVRQALRRANLFYIVAMPEFPREMAEKMGFQARFQDVYMQRFVEPLGKGDNKAAQLLDSKGYDSVIKDTFDDPMPHIVVPTLTKDILTQIWEQIEQQTRTVISPQQLVGMGVNRPVSSFLNEVASKQPDGKLPDNVAKMLGNQIPKHLLHDT